MSFGSRLAAATADYGHLCVGIDPHPALLDSWGLPQSPAGLEAFSKRVIAAASGHVSAIKPQVALFEAYGAKGFAVLEQVLAEAKAAGLLVIADAKRGDIGSTNAGYTRAWLAAEAPFMTDALTVSPYLGVHSLDDMAATAIANDKGLYVLAATSNPEATATQAAVSGSSNVAQLALLWAADAANGSIAQTPGSIGIVVGATIGEHMLGDAWSAPGADLVPILAPGFGAQGAKLSEFGQLFAGRARHTLANVSRSILGAGPDGLGAAISEANLELSAR